MANGDVTMKFDANTADFLQKILALSQAHQAHADKARKSGEEVAKTGESMDKAAEMAGKLTGSVGGAVVALTGLGAIGELAGKTVEDYLSRSEKKAGLLREQIEKINGLLAQSGQVSMAPQTREALASISSNTLGGGVVGVGEAEELFSQISRSRGARSSVAEKLRATRAGALGIGAGMNTEDAGRLGTTFAQIAGLEGFKGRSSEDIANAAFAVNQVKPEGLSERDLRFVERSGGTIDSLNMLIGAAKSEESSRGLEAIAQSAEAEFSDNEINKINRTAPRKRTDEENRILRLSAIPAGQRIQAILNDETLAPQSQRRAIRSLREGIGGGGQIQAAIKGDALGKAVGDVQFSYDPDQQLVNARKSVDVQRDRLSRRNASAALARETVLYQGITNSEETFGHSYAMNAANEIGSFLDTDEKMQSLVVENQKQVKASIDAMHQTVKQQNANTGLKNNGEGQK